MVNDLCRLGNCLIYQGKFQGPPIVGPLFPCYSHTIPIRTPWSMGVVWEAYGKGPTTGKSPNLNDIFCDQFETCQEIGDFLASGKRHADGTVLEIIRIERSLVSQRFRNVSLHQGFAMNVYECPIFFCLFFGDFVTFCHSHFSPFFTTTHLGKITFKRA